MIKIIKGYVLLLIVFLYPYGSTIGSAKAQELILDGDLNKPQRFSTTQFAGLPHVTIQVTTDAGAQVTYGGVDLGYILVLGDVPLKDKLKKPDIMKYLIAQGGDGFAAAFSLPEFDQGRFLVADSIDGKPLSANDGPWQVISPDEKRHTRWIKRLVLLRIKTASP